MSQLLDLDRPRPKTDRCTVCSDGDGRARLSVTGRVDRRVFGLRLELPG